MFLKEIEKKYEVISKAIPFEDGLHLNNEGGPSAPIRIEDLRDGEIQWRRGRPQILKTPQMKWEQDTKEVIRKRLGLTRDRGGANTGTLPDDPNAPMDKLNYKCKDEKVTEENIKAMSYLTRLASVLAKVALSFQDVLKLVKGSFPEIKMQFPKPPTYIWNPPAEEKPDESEDKDKDKAKEGEKDTEEPEEDENKAKLDPQKIKDKLKVKLPQLTWTLRMTDGVEAAELGFDDGSTALFEIGLKANHLTITYTEAKKKPEPRNLPNKPIKNVNIEEDNENDDEEVADEDWRA